MLSWPTTTRLGVAIGIAASSPYHRSVSTAAYITPAQWFRARRPGDLVVVSLGDGGLEEILRYGDWLLASASRSKIEKTGTAREWCLEHGVPLVRCPGYDMAVLAPITDDQVFHARMRWM